MTHRRQLKRFDARLNLNVPAELRAELEAAAAQSHSIVSDVARGVLVDWATARVIARGSPAPAQARELRQ